MVTQEKMKGPNGASESPPRAVAKGISEAVHDFISLMELQAQLFRLDLREIMLRVIVPGALLFAAVIAIVGCFPIALMALAELLIDSAGLSPALSFLIATVVGLIVAGSLGLGAWAYFRAGIPFFQRSRDEWGHTLDWVKQVLKRSATTEAAPRDVRRPYHD
jgi:hypothetical protein